jgi:hypothetical protein
MNNRGALPKGFWFWYHQPDYDVHLIRPCPPTFCIFDPEANKSPRQILKEYEEKTGNKVLLKSWDEAKKLTPAQSLGGGDFAGGYGRDSLFQVKTDW